VRILKKHGKIIKKSMDKIIQSIGQFLILILLISCNNSHSKVNEICYTKGCIDSLNQFYQWRGRVYTIKAYYHYYVNDSKYYGNSNNPNAKKFPFEYPLSNGDSVLIMFSKTDPSNSQVVERVYIKKIDYSID
jgi:hypothetical protein